MLNGAIPNACEECKKFVYKGDDEKYCRAWKMREIYLKKNQKKPYWCPLVPKTGETGMKVHDRKVDDE